MVFDSVRGVTVLFGGEVLNGPIMGDTWEWNGTTWTNRAPNPAPPARYSHAMAYDPVRGRTILFGGTGSAGLLGDTWEWDGTTWARAFPPGSPPARFGHVMAHHPDFRGPGAGEVVLFGGYGGTRLKDTWTWDGTRWCDLALQAGGPPAPTALTPRHYAAMTYDPGIQRLLLFGGDDGAFRSDTWELTAYLPPDFTYLGSGHPTGGLDLRFAGFPVIGTSLNAVLNDSPLRSTGFNLLVVGIPVPVPYPIGPPGVCNTGSTIWVSPLVPLSGVAFPATIRIDIPLAPALIGSVWGVQGAAFEFALSCYRTSDAVKVQLR
jgi:hypothetical protein